MTRWHPYTVTNNVATSRTKPRLPSPKARAHFAETAALIRWSFAKAHSTIHNVFCRRRVTSALLRLGLTSALSPPKTRRLPLRTANFLQIRERPPNGRRLSCQLHRSTLSSTPQVLVPARTREDTRHNCQAKTSDRQNQHSTDALVSVCHND